MGPDLQLAALLLLSAVFITEAAHTFPGYRLVQWSQGASNFGSQRAYVSLQASTAVKGAGRRIVVISAADYAEAWQKSNKSISLGSKIDGLLIVLPSADSSSPVPKDWQEIENQLVHASIPFPVYFAQEDEAVRAFLSDLQATGGGALSSAVSNTAWESLVRDSWLLTAPAAENEKVAMDLPLVNVQGWLAGEGLTAQGDALPTVLIVAHYDAFAAAPGLALGASSNAAGVTAVLELARLFAKLFSRTAAKANLLFLLAAAGKHNFAGSRHWLNAADQRLLDTVDAVVCLDSLAGPSLYVHSSKTAKEPRVQEIFESFSSAGKMLDVPVEIVHKKINVSASEMSWEHEHFARKKLFALTASSRREPHSPLADSHLFDTAARLDASQLARNVRVVAEALARVLFPLLTSSSTSSSTSQHAVFDGPFAVNQDFVKSWLDALAAQSRFALFVRKESPLLAGMERSLSNDARVEVRRSSFQLPQDVRKFFGAPSVVMTASLTKSVLFEVVLSAAVLGYLFTLSFALGGTTFLSNMKSLSAKAVRKAPLRK